MITRIRLLLVALGLAGCAAPGAAAPEPEGCSLSVSFGSYAMGIDRSAAAAIDRLVEGHADVAAVSRQGAGREGEYMLCVATRSQAGAARLFAEIRKLLPPRPVGPIRVEAPGLIYSVPAG